MQVMLPQAALQVALKGSIWHVVQNFQPPPAHTPKL